MIKKIISKLKNKIFKIKRNIYYFFFKYFFKKPTIMSKEDTLDRIIKDNISVARFGDGEYSLILGHPSIGFQDGGTDIAHDLLKTFQTRNEKLLICAMPLCDEKNMNNIYGNTIKTYVLKSWKIVKRLFDYKYIYGSSYISRFYHPHIAYNDTQYKYLVSEYIPKLRSIWDNRKVLIVEGEGTKLGVGNDLLNNAQSIKRIICPSKNAYSKFDVIMNTVVSNCDGTDLILLALGPTATILSARLTIDYKLQCIDIGHVDIVYMWMLDKATTKIKYVGKDMNETKIENNKVCIETPSSEYMAQIIATIK